MLCQNNKENEIKVNKIADTGQCGMLLHIVFHAAHCDISE